MGLILTFCVEGEEDAATDGLLLAESTEVLSVKTDRSSRLFMVEVRWKTEGGYEEGPLASDVDDAMSNDFCGAKDFRKVGKKEAWMQGDGERYLRMWRKAVGMDAHHSMRVVAVVNIGRDGRRVGRCREHWWGFGPRGGGGGRE
jgi:hypothetical protein